jgi:hypothetical protein
VMSFTSAGWTANQFVPGTRMTCTGITPSGYNSVYPGWYILSNSGTVITAVNQTTGLSAGTVFGACIASVQQTVDSYQILNFGAGNYTLTSCLGLEGPSKNIYIKNINAASSTVVAFGTELIDGAGSATVAQNATLVLQPTLLSTTTAGCGWKKVQNN